MRRTFGWLYSLHIDEDVEEKIARPVSSCTSRAPPLREYCRYTIGNTYYYRIDTVMYQCAYYTILGQLFKNNIIKLYIR